MAVMNRPVVGQVKCITPGCTQTATVHETEKGTRKGQLYLRCPECKCLQPSGEKAQAYIRSNMVARPGHEDLQTRTTTDTAQVSEQEPDDLQVSDTDETEAEQPTGISGFLLAGLAVASLIMGVRAK